jgi:hypothetical protein
MLNQPKHHPPAYELRHFINPIGYVKNKIERTPLISTLTSKAAYTRQQITKAKLTNVRKKKSLTSKAAYTRKQRKSAKTTLLNLQVNQQGNEHKKNQPTKLLNLQVRSLPRSRLMSVVWFSCLSERSATV